LDVATQHQRSNHNIERRIKVEENFYKKPEVDALSSVMDLNENSDEGDNRSSQKSMNKTINQFNNTITSQESFGKGRSNSYMIAP